MEFIFDVMIGKFGDLYTVSGNEDYQEGADLEAVKKNYCDSVVKKYVSAKTNLKNDMRAEMKRSFSAFSLYKTVDITLTNKTNPDITVSFSAHILMHKYRSDGFCDCYTFEYPACIGSGNSEEEAVTDLFLEFDDEFVFDEDRERAERFVAYIEKRKNAFFGIATLRADVH